MSSDKAKLSNSGLSSVIGITPTKVGRKDDNRVTNTFRLTNEELSRVLKRTYVQPDANTRASSSQSSAQGIRSYLNPIAEAIGERHDEVKKMKALAPEIDQSRMLVASSILSPNDLGEGTFNFILDHVPSISKDTDLNTAIQKVLSEHFNDNLKLGIRSFDWVGDALYGSGAQPILILPQATLEEAIHKQVSPAEGSYFSFSTSTESFQGRLGLDSAPASEYDDFFYSGKGLTMAEWLDDMDNVVTTTECFPYVKDQDLLSYDIDDNAAPTEEQYLGTMERMVAHLKKKLSTGDVIKISEDPTIMKWSTTNKKRSKDMVINKFGGYSAQSPYKPQDIISLNPNPESGHYSHPLLIELPTESVIPIHVPGSPAEHLGYFVLIDPYGNPIKYDAMDHSSNPLAGAQMAGIGTQATAAAAHTSIFGKDGASTFGGLNRSQSVGNLLFNNILDKYIKSRLEGLVNKSDLEVSRYNAVAAVMLQRLMANKRTTLLYVPTSLMTYIAFDFNEQGCGKSRLEDLRPLLAMRTNLMMAQIIAAANNAIEHKVVQFDTPDNLANLEGIMEIIHQVFQRKRNVTGSFVPEEISSNLYSNRTLVLPSKIPGLDGSLKVDVESKGGNSIAPDDNLLEMLTNLIGSMMIMHPSALNSLNEPEHSRSLATMNMFYSKQITQLQTIYCEYITEFVKTYIQFSKPLQTLLLKTISDHYQTDKDNNVPAKLKAKLRKGDTNLQYSRGAHALLDAILTQIEVRLPAPNIIVGKSQFEEVRSYVDIINTMADILFSSEMLPSNNAEANEALTVVKSHWKYNQIKEFTSRVGDNNLYDIPEPDHFIDILDMNSGTIEALMNIHADLDGMYATIMKSRREMDAAATDDAMGGDDGGFGGDEDQEFDMDMGGDDSSDMGDSEDESFPEMSDSPDEGNPDSDDSAQMVAPSLVSDADIPKTPSEFDTLRGYLRNLWNK